MPTTLTIVLRLVVFIVALVPGVPQSVIVEEGPVLHEILLAAEDLEADLLPHPHPREDPLGGGAGRHLQQHRRLVAFSQHFNTVNIDSMD